MTKINPRKIDGPWTDGRVLDLHSTGSEFLGYDLAKRFRFPVVKAVSKNAAGAAELKNLHEYDEREAVSKRHSSAEKPTTRRTPQTTREAQTTRRSRTKPCLF